ncbi:hypothetical protein OSTOST_08948 [Ostertagia ostertagi]
MWKTIRGYRPDVMFINRNGMMNWRKLAQEHSGDEYKLTPEGYEQVNSIGLFMGAEINQTMEEKIDSTLRKRKDMISQLRDVTTFGCYCEYFSNVNADMMIYCFFK